MMKCQEKERAGRGRLLPRKHRRPRSALVPGMDDHNQHLLGVQMMTGRILTAVFGFVMSIAVAPLTMGQSLVATKGDLTFAASYGYSQRHHDGPWVLIDVGYGSDRYGSIQPRKTFHLLTPDGGRIDLPDQREYRAGLNDIRAMSAGAATMQLSPWLALPIASLRRSYRGMDCRRARLGDKQPLSAGLLPAAGTGLCGGTAVSNGLSRSVLAA